MALIGSIRRIRRSSDAWLPPLNFITLHYAYFVLTCLICAGILYGSSTPGQSVSFVDALFLVTSAMTEAGLNTINLSTLNTFQQTMLFILIMLGSAIWVSAWVVFIRRNAFERKFRDVIAERKRQQRARRDSRSRSRLSGRRRLTDAEDKYAQLQREPQLEAIRPIVSNTAVTFDSAAAAQARKRATNVLNNDAMSTTTSNTYTPRSRSDIGRYFDSVGGWVSRNSEFHGLTAVERIKLGGWEYRALSYLAWLVPCYYVIWQLLGGLGCAAWVAYNQPDTALMNGLNPWWVGAFNAISAFNNSGMSLLDANMTAFQRSYYMLLTMGLLILAGNTCYPIFLRLIVWTMYKISSSIPGERWEARTKTLRFLLDHPRRCYTNLFPARHTWWLLCAVVTLNGIDWAAFEIFNINNSLLDDTLPTNIRVIDGLFQAFAVRSGGFYVVTIPNLRIALLVLYVIMMYISPYPVVLTMRNSNVYEERSLGIYAGDPKRDVDEDYDPALEKKESNQSFVRRAAHLAGQLAFGGAQTGRNTHFVRQQFRAQLSSDAWVIALALLLIMIIDNQKFVDDPVNFSVFNVLFELVSGYGTVGISVGVPDDAYSFCGNWSTLSKLVLCFVMLRGRHRGLPVAIDKAILLPGDASEEAEEDDGRIRMARSMELDGRREVV